MECLFGELVDLASRPETEPGHRKRVFREWLELSLQVQHAELRRYLDGQDDPAALLRRWESERWYEQLVPACAQPAERELFLSDFEIIAGVAYSDFQPESANPDLVRSKRTLASRGSSFVMTKIGRFKEALNVRRWVSGHRY